jgi:hypothetical protein
MVTRWRQWRHTHMRTLTIAATILLVTFPTIARDHNILNGTWTLIPMQSDFAGQPVIQTGTVTISDREGAIVLARNFQYEGAHETFFYEQSLGNEDNSSIHSGKELKTKTKWEHDVLTVTTSQPGNVTVESYHLAPDGTMTANVEIPGHPPITLHFKRQ